MLFKAKGSKEMQKPLIVAMYKALDWDMVSK
jgi:hypothetical protein